MTSQKQILLFTEDTSTSSQVDFRVKTQVKPNKTAKVNKGYKVSEQDCFGKCSGLFGKSDQIMLLPRTSVTFLKLTEGKTLEQSSVNWPDWGIMQNGEFVERQKSARPITVQGCIWLLTPTASESHRDKLSFPMYSKRHHRSPGGLSEQLYRLFGPVPGRVNPQLYAWMMGYPLNWLDNSCTDTETQ